MERNPKQEEIFSLPEKSREAKKEGKNIFVLRKEARKTELIEEMRNKNKPSKLHEVAEEIRKTDPENNPNIINLKEVRNKK